MKFCYPILFSLLLVSSSFLGQGMLDSLLSIDQSNRPVRKNVFTNINISREYFILGEYELGVAYGKKGMELAKEVNNDTLLGQSSFFTGLNAFEIKPDSGFAYYKKSIELLLPLQHDWTVFAINNLCTEYTKMSWYSEALEYRLKSLDFFKERSDTLMIIHSMVRVGFIHDRIGEFEEALKWYSKAEPIALQSDDPAGIADVYAYRGIAYDELQQYDSAHFYNKKAIELFQQMGDDFAYKNWCSNIGNTYLKQENYSEAKKYLLISLESSEEITDEDNSIKMINLSKVYYHEQEYTKGDSLLNRAIAVGKDFSQYKFLGEAYFTLSASMEERGEGEKALQYYKLYKVYEDSSFNEEKSNQIAYHNAKFKTQEKEKELLVQKTKSQELQNDKLSLDLKLADRNNLLILLFAALILGGLLTFFLFLRNKRKHEQEKSRALLEEKDKAAKAVIGAQEAERTRIARELHDGIVQELTLLKRNLLNIKGANDVQQLAEIAADLDKSAQEVRNISHQLMPYALQELGLLAALEDMFEKTLSHADIEFSFDVIGVSDRFPSSIEVAIYRIAQELINNVIKHSGATVLEVLLSYRNGVITFRLEDNGVGMSSEGGHGIGLQSIQGRADLLKGTVRFENAGERGVVTLVRIPFQKA